MVMPPAGVDAVASSAGSLTARIRRFAGKVMRKVSSPLLSLPVQKSPSPPLPHRSKRIAAQPLSRFPVAKRGEILAMQRLGYIDRCREPIAAEKAAYDNCLKYPNPSHKEALRRILAGGTPRRSTRRASRRA